MRSDPKLWERVKREVTAGSKGGPAGKWSARKAQMAVQEYKRRGGTYTTPKPRNNSLTKWTAEAWGYSGEPGASRYLPAKVREAAPPALLAKENARKGSRKGEKVPYSKELVKIMRRKGVLSGSA